MKARFHFADGRIEEDTTVDERVQRHAIREGDTLRWFIKTKDAEADGYAVFRESTAGVNERSAKNR